MGDTLVGPFYFTLLPPRHGKHAPTIHYVDMDAFSKNNREEKKRRAGRLAALYC